MSIPSTVSAASVLTHPHEFSGTVALKSLPRVAAAAGGEKGEIKAELTADRSSGYPRLHGTLEGALELVCQRCAKRYDWPVELKVDLRLVFSEQEEKAALQNSDPYLIEDDRLPVKELVEDEVLLALPMLQRCEKCEDAVTAASRKKAAKQKEETRRDNPFAALKGKLKQ